GHEGADLDDAETLTRFFDVIQELNRDGLLLAYHDRSDGGLLATLAEMAFAGRTGLNVELDDLPGEPLALLFNEELGAVVQVRHTDTDDVLKALHDAGLGHCSQVIGALNDDQQIRVSRTGKLLLEASRVELQQAWSEVTRQMQALRDNPSCAEEEFERIAADDPGIQVSLSFDPAEDVAGPMIASGVHPK
ncbi:hypothetical protein QQ73_02955, partial [Candidatus Endoriftia persephone str. Guaymas]|nr:hypothetical protein [Candidatus Endoriftia persephone str. Guaymas]